MIGEQFISFKLKAVSLKEDARWEFINLDQVRVITIKPETIFFFDNRAAMSISKEDHPEAYKQIRDFLLKRVGSDNLIVEESEDY